MGPPLACGLLVAFLSSLLISHSSAGAPPPHLPGPYQIFKTEPEFVPSVLEITQNIKSQQAPGYFFVAPHMGARGWGPQILDHGGELVWYGEVSVRNVKGRTMNGMNFYRCDYKGSMHDHLCFSEAAPDKEDRGYRSIGVNRVLDSSYKSVTKPYSKVGKLWYPNPHEFNMLPGGKSFLQSVYQMRKVDLTPYAGEKEGYVYDGCFQEIDTDTRKAIFEWCFLKHYPLWKSYVYLHVEENKVNWSTPTGGQGTLDDPWDPIHLNALDKNEDNDYIFSGRHLMQVLKIAGPNSKSGKKAGTTLWRFGGKDSDFEAANETLIGMQHHARYISSTKTETILSLFDNYGQGGQVREVPCHSTAKLIKLNNETMKSELLHAYHNQDETKCSIAQGSAQLLSNGNFLAGWGSRPQVSEYTEDGELIFHGEFHSDKGGLTNYRAFKFDWVGNPVTKPQLLAYCKTCNPFGATLTTEASSQLVAYVSWNGATEVKSWRFYMSAHSAKGPWVNAGTFEKEGFETRAVLNAGATFRRLATFAPFVRVEALDKHDNVLDKNTRRTFVPTGENEEDCDDYGCFHQTRFHYRDGDSRSKTCGINLIPMFLCLVFLLFGVEVTVSWTETALGAMILHEPYAESRGSYASVANQRRSKRGV